MAVIKRGIANSKTPPRDFGHAKTLDQQELWRGSIGRFCLDDIELPDGRRFTLAILRHPSAAAVVPFVDAETVLMLRQYRHAAGGTLWEVPAGKLDPGEDPEACALRELEEETGFRAGRIERLGHIHTSPGFTDEVIHLFSAYELEAGSTSLDAQESLETVPVTVEVLRGMIDGGEITDAKTLCALELAFKRR